MSEGVVVLLARGRIVSCNTAAERILGLTRDQMAGRTALDPRWRPIHEDGSETWTILTGSPLHAANGSYAWALAMVTDISERKAAEAETRCGGTRRGWGG
jgi:PAS domain-containing protein